MTVSRRALLRGLGGGALGAVVLAGCSTTPTAPAAPTPPATGPVPGVADLERTFGSRIGTLALDTGTGAAVGHRVDERFLMASVVKALMAGFVLHRSVTDPGLLERRVRWGREELLEYAPVTRAALGTGLTVGQLCDAAVTVSDNTAHNVLLREVGSPAEVTAWLRGLGDTVTRADRIEGALNVVDGEKDTSSPAALAATLRALTVDDGLPPPQRDRLVAWLLANTTGDDLIRAGLPAGWRAGEKTGQGAAGERNDSGVLYPPEGAPVILTVFVDAADPDDERGEEAVAATTRAVLAALRR